MNYTCSKCGKEFDPILIPKYGEKLLCFKCRPKTTTAEFFKEATDEVAKYNAEIRKPLEDEIESLKNKLADLTEEYKLTVEAFDREYAKQNVQLRKAFNERNGERLKVIAELEEWVENNTSEGIYDEREDKWYLCVQIENINQKLNEMKGEKDE